MTRTNRVGKRDDWLRTVLSQHHVILCWGQGRGGRHRRDWSGWSGWRWLWMWIWRQNFDHQEYVAQGVVLGGGEVAPLQKAVLDWLVVHSDRAFDITSAGSAALALVGVSYLCIVGLDSVSVRVHLARRYRRSQQHQQ